MTARGSTGSTHTAGPLAAVRRSWPVGAERAGSASPRARAMSWARRLNIILPGSYAWGATLAYPVVLAGGPLPAWVSCAGALGVLLWGGVRNTVREDNSGFGGVLGFFALAGTTWVLLGAERMRLVEPLQAAFGSVGWLLCALGWGGGRNASSIPEEDPRVVSGVPLAARRRTPKRALLYFVLAGICAATVMLTVWMVERPAVGVLAHLVAIACASWILLVGAQLGRFASHTWSWGSGRERLLGASRALSLLVLVALAGLLVRILAV